MQPHIYDVVGVSACVFVLYYYNAYRSIHFFLLLNGKYLYSPAAVSDGPSSLLSIITVFTSFPSVVNSKINSPRCVSGPRYSYKKKIRRNVKMINNETYSPFSKSVFARAAAAAAVFSCASMKQYNTPLHLYSAETASRT